MHLLVEGQKRRFIRDLLPKADRTVSRVSTPETQALLELQGLLADWKRGNVHALPLSLVQNQLHLKPGAGNADVVHTSNVHLRRATEGAIQIQEGETRIGIFKHPGTDDTDGTREILTLQEFAEHGDSITTLFRAIVIIDHGRQESFYFMDSKADKTAYYCRFDQYGNALPPTEYRTGDVAGEVNSIEIGEHLAQNLATLRRELRNPLSYLHPRRRRIKERALRETPNGFDAIFSEILLAVADGRAIHASKAFGH